MALAHVNGTDLFYCPFAQENAEFQDVVRVWLRRAA
jgi:hypothetical protein